MLFMRLSYFRTKKTFMMKLLFKKSSINLMALFNGSNS
jgi:hypothetical protein